jgi:hypothetical protein
MPENTKPIKDENPDTVLDLQAEGDSESDEVEAHAGGSNCVSLVSVVEK